MRALREAFFISVLSLVGLLTGCSKPEDPALLHRTLGNDYASNGDWAAAAKEYGLSLQANPREPRVWQLKANAQLNLGQTGEAAESLAKSAEYASDVNAKAEAYRLVAGMYVDRREFVEAEKAFVETLKFAPRDELALAWLGEIASARGGARLVSDPPDPAWLTRAIAYYDQAISVNPKNLFSYVNKRIAIHKYIVFEQQEKTLAERLIQVEHRDASKVAAAQLRLTDSVTQIESFEKQIEELSNKIKELQAAEKAKKPSTS